VFLGTTLPPIDGDGDVLEQLARLFISFSGDHIELVAPVLEPLALGPAAAAGALFDVVDQAGLST
jgi:hypothetical protein